jgi:hypothetical protein
MHLSWDEQVEQTIAYAMLLGGEFSQENPLTWWCTGKGVGSFVGRDKYVAACRYIDYLGYYLHTNGTLMRARP